MKPSDEIWLLPMWGIFVLTLLSTVTMIRLSRSTSLEASRQGARRLRLYLAWTIWLLIIQCAVGVGVFAKRPTPPVPAEAPGP